jgi:hypothetical protein
MKKAKSVADLAIRRLRLHYELQGVIKDLQKRTREVEKLHAELDELKKNGSA